MSIVLAFDATEPSFPATAPLRLRRLSNGLAIFFSALMGFAIAWAGAAFLFCFPLNDHVRMNSGGAFIDLPALSHPVAGTIIFSTQPFIAHLAGFVDVSIATAPLLATSWHLRSLFRLYSNGIVFGRENAVHLKHVGLWLCVYPFLKFAANIIFQMAGGADKRWFHAEILYALLLGAVVIAIAQVMEFGRDIEQDNAEIV
jgi:hypothetical protein